MRSLIISTLFIAASSSVTMTANAQWGTGGGAGAYTEDDALPMSSQKIMKGAKDILDDIHGFDDGELPPQARGKPTMNGFGDMDTQEDGTKTFRKRGGGKTGAPDPRDDEYVDIWMPTARKGFVVPERYTKSLNVQKDQLNGEGEEDDVEEILNERARKEMPKHSPGVQTRRIDKCLRQVAKFCSFALMDEDFSAFSKCVYDVRHYVKSSCFEWCDNHGRCAGDMVTYCAKKSPMDTTECMLAKKDIMSTDCTDSPYFKSLEEGIEEMRNDRDAAKKNREADNQGMPSQSPEEDDGPRFAGGKGKDAVTGKRYDGQKGADEYNEDDVGLSDDASEVLSTTYSEDEL